MMKRGAEFCIIVLLLAGLTISPALGSIIEADESNVNVYFWDLTGKRPIKKVIEFTDTQWNNLRNQLSKIKAESQSIEESLNSQFVLFKQYGFISYDTNYQILKEKADKAFEGKTHRPARSLLPNNVIINAICAIDFELNNGSTFVFGLNTFMNLVGFDIISFHKGYTHGGIHTTGLVKQSTDAGTYLGSMFGLLGYWLGTKTGTGTYSDVTVAGFTVFTGWFPLET